MAVGKPAAFSQLNYKLSNSVSLSPIAAFEAEQLSIMCIAMEPWARYPIRASELASHFARQEVDASRFAVRIEGRMEGAFVLRTRWLAGPYLQTLALARNVQGAGIGTLIMAFIEAEARRAGDRNLWVAASEFNGGALRFYERQGYQRIADLDGLIAQGRTEVLLRKKLFN